MMMIKENEKLNQEAIKLIKESKKLEEKAANLYGKASYLRRQAELVCIHNQTELKYDYQSGSYLDRAVYIKKVVCEICGKVLDEERTIGGYE